MFEGVALLDRRGCYLLACPPPAGLDFEELCGRQFWERSLGEDLIALRSAIARALMGDHTSCRFRLVVERSLHELHADFLPGELDELGVIVLWRIVPGSLRKLSDKEREVAVMIGQGQSARQIQSALTITSSTLATHKSRICHKLGMNSSGMTAWCARYLESLKGSE